MPTAADSAVWYVCDDCQNVYHESEVSRPHGSERCSCGCPEFSREEGYICDVCGVDYSTYDDARMCEEDHDTEGEDR